MAVYLDPSSRGFGLVRQAIALTLSKGSIPSAVVFSAAHYGPDSQVTTCLKAAVAAGTTTDATWAGPLASSALSDDFIAFARSRSALEQLVLRQTEFNTRTPLDVEGGIAVGWVGQGAPKPVSSTAFDTAELLPFKLSAVAVATNEQLRMSNAEKFLRAVMVSSFARMQDSAFFSADAATGTNPAGILNGLTPLAATTSGVADIADLVEAFEGNLETSFLVMSPRNAVALGLSTSPPLDVGARGGSLAGIPVVTTRYVPADSSGSAIILLDGSEILFAAGPVEVASATSATIEMLDNPTNNSASATATSMVSLFQTNSAAIRIERFISWKVARPSAAAWIESAAYGSA
jgi:Phage capsid family